MTAARARYTPEAAALIRKLQPDSKRHIRAGIRELLESPLAGHELHFDLSGFRSYRVKTYRIIYRYNEAEAFLEVHYVGHRRTVYESFHDLLAESR